MEGAPDGSLRDVPAPLAVLVIVVFGWSIHVTHPVSHSRIIGVTEIKIAAECSERLSDHGMIGIGLGGFDLAHSRKPTRDVYSAKRNVIPS